MIIPVRCFTCGALIADKWDEFCAETIDYATTAAFYDSEALNEIF